jgi:hypothetical protein
MLSNDLTTTGRPAGRPVSIDPEAIAALALKMFAERGYEQTSMEDIAREAGVGRKSRTAISRTKPTSYGAEWDPL